MPFRLRKNVLNVVVMLLAFVNGALCAICSFSDGLYRIEWSVDRKNVVHFQLQLSNIPNGINVWTGVAFGEDMFSGLDATIVRVINGQISVSDEYVQGYGPSWIDQEQNVQTQQANLINNVLTVRFTKPVSTNDIGDHSLDGCTTWQFITSPGAVYSSHIGKHTRHPISRTVCLNQCSI